MIIGGYYNDSFIVPFTTRLKWKCTVAKQWENRNNLEKKIQCSSDQALSRFGSANLTLEFIFNAYDIHMLNHFCLFFTIALIN